LGLALHGSLCAKKDEGSFLSSALSPLRHDEPVDRLAAENFLLGWAVKDFGEKNIYAPENLGLPTKWRAQIFISPKPLALSLTAPPGKFYLC
jgi:hypothetical protein